MKKINPQYVAICELEKANKVINRFITACSHEMRAPLKSIEGLVNLLKNKDQFAESDSDMFIDLIGKTTAKMDEMLNALEYLMENTTRNVSDMAVNCQSIVTSIINSFQQEIEGSRITIVSTVIQTGPVFSDSPRLHVILTELLKNAIEFRDAQKPATVIDITIITFPDYWMITVEDNGVGIHSLEQPKVFELFYRSSEKSSGSGVGLYLVREAVEKMGGTIGLESIPQTGSVFRVKLPNHALLIK